MSDSSAFDFGKFIPGFDFLQNLAASGKGAAGPVGGLHNWVAPTVSVDELDKRIQELKAVLFWLEQNGTALKATIQALEVQKMTLATLQGMNVSMAEVAKAFTIPTPDVAAAPVAAAAEPAPSRPDQWPFSATPAAPQADPAPAPAAAPEAAPAPPAEPDPEPAAPAPKAAPARKRKPAAKAAAAPAAPGLTDPMQWWGALTQQFQHIAANALRDAGPPPTGAAPDAPDSVADGGASKAPTAKKTARKGAAAKRPARKSPAKPARKAAGKKAAPAARKSPSGKTAAADPAPAKKTKPAATGWPLPPPFKFGR